MEQKPIRMVDFRFFILVAGVFSLLLSNLTQGKECEETHNITKFRRIYLGSFDGPLVGVFGREGALLALGGCRTPEEHAKRMIDFFQTTYGINVTHVKQDPFRRYEEDQYLITQHATPQTNPGIIISGVTPGYARFMNTPLHRTSWTLMVKTNIRTLNGVIPPGYSFSFGMYRFHVDGRDACVEYKLRSPMGFLLPNSGAAGLDQILYEPEFREGHARGMGIVLGNQVALRYVITFPG